MLPGQGDRGFESRAFFFFSPNLDVLEKNTVLVAPKVVPLERSWRDLSIDRCALATVQGSWFSRKSRLNKFATQDDIP